MPQPAIRPPTAPEAEVRVTKLSSFTDPKFQAAFEAGLENTRAKQTGQPPSKEIPPVEGEAQPDPPKPKPAPEPDKPDETPQPDKPAEPGDPPPRPALTPKQLKTSADWDRMKAKHEAELEAIRAELEKAKAEPLLASIEKERDELRRELQAVAAERDPAFQREFSQKRESALTQLKTVAPKLGEKLATLAQLPPGPDRDDMVSALIKDLPPWQQSQIGVAMLEYSKVAVEREAKLKATQEGFELAAARQAREAELQQAAHARAFTERAKQWQDHLSGGDEQSAAAYQTALAEAEKVFRAEGIDPVSKTDIVIQAALYKLTLQDSLAKAKRIEQLEAQVKALTAADPAPGAGTAADIDSDEDEDAQYKGRSAGEIMAAKAVRMGLLQR
jgi:hypothetical protein